MNTLAELLSTTTTTLQMWSLCNTVRVLETNRFSDSQFAFKLRAELKTGGIFQVRIYRNGEHTDYAYYFSQGEVSFRWDNKEHFPDISSHPHHFHHSSGQIESSPLSGDLTVDLPITLRYLTAFMRR